MDAFVSDIFKEFLAEVPTDYTFDAPKWVRFETGEIRFCWSSSYHSSLVNGGDKPVSAGQFGIRDELIFVVNRGSTTCNVGFDPDDVICIAKFIEEVSGKTIEVG